MGEEFFWRTQTQLKIYFFVSIMILCNVEPSTQSSDVDCILYNEEFMECTWTHSEGEVNYTLYHWYNSEPPQECKNHIQQHGYNVGCHFSAHMIQLFKNFYVFRNGSSSSGDISKGPQRFQLQNQVKPFAPGNLVVNATEDNGLLLSWDSSMSNIPCLDFEVRYQNMDRKWQKATVLRQTNFNLPSVDPEKLYTFQVKSKVNKYCGTTKLWSEWSLPVHWGRSNTENNQRAFNPLILLATVPAFVFFIFIIYLTYKRSRMK